MYLFDLEFWLKMKYLLTAECWHLHAVLLFDSLPNDKILDRSRFKACAEDKINATENLKFVLWRVENIVEKGVNAGNQHFLLFSQYFQKASWDCVVNS